MIIGERSADDIVWGTKGKDARMFAKFCRLFGCMEPCDFGLALFTAQKMARQRALK
jgi:hypothetical protein